MQCYVLLAVNRLFTSAPPMNNFQRNPLHIQKLNYKKISVSELAECIKEQKFLKYEIMSKQMALDEHLAYLNDVYQAIQRKDFFFLQKVREDIRSSLLPLMVDWITEQFVSVHRNRLLELLGIEIEQLDKIAEESGWRREGEFYLFKQKEISCEKHSIASLSVIGHAK